MQLLHAFDCASDLGCSCWDFSVEIERLLAVGMTTSDLRWLIKRGYLSHAREVTGPNDLERRFDPQYHSLAFSETTCFVLTASGLAILGRELSAEERLSVESSCVPNRCGIAARAEARPTEMPAANPAEQPVPALHLAPLRPAAGPLSCAGTMPVWDHDSRTFMVGEHVVKQFRVPSPNQEAILNAFQEEGWPTCVDDPLSPVPGQSPKRRLRDTIKGLNANQAAPVIRFHGDGTGQRVTWKLLIGSAAPTINRRSPSLRRAA
jgi:hypothetical protein